MQKEIRTLPIHEAQFNKVQTNEADGKKNMDHVRSRNLKIFAYFLTCLIVLMAVFVTYIFLRGQAILPSANAQSVLLEGNKKNWYQSFEIQQDTGTINLAFDFLGPILDSKIINETVNCKSIKSYYFMMQYFTANKEHQAGVNSWAHYYSQCKEKVPNKLLALDEWVHTKDHSEEALKKILYHYFDQSRDADLIKKIINIYHIKENKRKKINLMQVLNMADEMLEQSEKQKWTMSQLSEKLENINTEGGHFIQKLARSILAMQRDNESWVKEIILDIITSDKREIYFIGYDLFAREKNISLRLKYFIMKYISALQDYLQNKALFKLYITNLTELFDEEFQKNLKEKYDAAWSLAEVREMVKSPTYGETLPTIWLPILYKRSSYQEASEYLIQVLNLNSLKKNPRKLLWTFHYQEQISEHLQKQLMPMLDDFYNSEDLYLKFIFFELSDHTQLKRKILNTFKISENDLRIQKIKFYWQLVETANGIEIGIFELMNQKIYDYYLFWWLLL